MNLTRARNAAQDAYVQLMNARACLRPPRSDTLNAVAALTAAIEQATIARDELLAED